MRTREQQSNFTVTPIVYSATPVIDTNRLAGNLFFRCDNLVLDVTASVTGGTLDIYLQRKVAPNSWLDWVHYPQLASGQTKAWTVSMTGEGPVLAGTLITEVGRSTDTTVTSLALAANYTPNCLPGGDVRVVYVTGTGVTAGSITVVATPYTEHG